MATRRRKADQQSEQPQEAGKPLSGIAALEDRLGWKFRDPALLQLALTHRSFAYEAKHGINLDPYGRGKNAPGEDNEQLEFVGDAVLGLVVTEAMFREFPDRTEGELTRLRSALVSRERMSRVGEELGLGELILLGKSAERMGSRLRPALLANAAEAVLAALYLDAKEQGMDVVRKVIHQFLIDPELPHLHAALEHDEGRGALRDSKTLLQERVQATASGRLQYVDIAESGPAHQRRFEVEARLEKGYDSYVLASAEGNSKKEAQQRAAAEALENWAKLAEGIAVARSAS